MGTSKGNLSKPLNLTGFADYCNRKRERQNYSFRIDCSGGYYLVNGQRMEENEFNNLFPIGLIDQAKGERLDSRQNIF